MCVSLCLYYYYLQMCSRYKISGELPLLSLRISDDKLRSVLELVDSIPLPESRPAAHGTAPSASTKVSAAGPSIDGPKCVSFSHFDGSNKVP